MYDKKIAKSIMKHGRNQLQKPTPKQFGFVKALEEKHNVKFKGRYRWEATEFIDKYKNKR